MKHITANKELIGNNVWMVEIEFHPENDQEKNAINNFEAGTAGEHEKELLDNCINRALGKMSPVQFVKQRGCVFIVTASL